MQVEKSVVAIQDQTEMAHRSTDELLVELSELNLAAIGGGCAEVCPY